MVEMEEFKHGGTNITAYRMVDPQHETVQKVRGKQESYLVETTKTCFCLRLWTTGSAGRRGWAVG